MLRLKEWAAKINIEGEIRLQEPMSLHTTFGVGGPAEVFARPASTGDVVTLLGESAAAGVPAFILGGGANILVSDRGIPGLVIHMGALASIHADGRCLTAGAGLPVSDAAAWAANHRMAGLEFIYSMPGSVGGAVWMNARCYGSEIFDVLDSVEYVTSVGAMETYVPRAEDFDYKRSPFQDSDRVMTGVRFRLSRGEPASLWRTMWEHEEDRRSKGHFSAPCAGSVFKNSRAFGSPSGALIDRLGLRGFQIGGARVSDLHANIVVNAGSATAGDIKRVFDHIQAEVRRQLGFDLEREVLLVGDWGET